MEKSFRGEIFSHLLWFSRQLKEKGLNYKLRFLKAFLK